MSEISTSVKTVTDTISVCLKNNLTFAAYRLPNKDEQMLVVQKASDAEEVKSLSNLSNLKGFLVAPYILSRKNSMFKIHPDYYFKGEVSEKDYSRLQEIMHPEQKPKTITKPVEVSKTEYVNQIETILSAIEKGKLQKAVLSRIKVVHGKYKNLVADIFQKLCDLFPNAFVYVFKTNDHFWMGASPEPFAFLQNSSFQTSSVAGTKENTKKYHWINNWGKKEKQEQQYVSDHIDRVLQNVHLKNIIQHGPYVKEAGNLLHLQTDFSTSAKAINGNIGVLLSNLHPTPAVCGYPAKEAQKIISSVEKHDREYYGGFLGPIGIENQMKLFVNLRCLQVFDDHLLLYSGGGITIDSNPADEWYETEIKTGTVLSAIETVI